MAIAKEEVLNILGLEATDETSAIAEAIINAFTKDFEDEKTKILLNKEEIKNEKKEETKKRQALEEQNKQLSEKLGQMQKQLDDNSPDAVKKIYESQLDDAKKVFDAKYKELEDKYKVSEQTNATLKKSQHRLTCMEQFNKAIAAHGNDVAADSLDDFALFVLGPDCCKFAERSLGEGNTAIVTSEGQTIDSAVKAALETNFGKSCRLFKSSGGGAEGGARGGSSGDKTISRSEFDAKDPSEKAKLMAEHYRIV